jgi:hypothetical protein
MRIVRGRGVIEDRIKANIARRKAVAEKRDEAQSFLENIGKKAQQIPKPLSAAEVANRRDYAQFKLETIGEKAREKVSHDKYLYGIKLAQYGFYLKIYYAIEYLIENGMKDRSFKKAFKNYKTALNEFGDSFPEKDVKKVQEQIFEDDDGVRFSKYHSFDLKELGIENGKARKNTSFMLNKYADNMRSYANEVRSLIK